VHWFGNFQHATARHIDQLLYDLYGLTAEEIKIVEEGTAK